MGTPNRPRPTLATIAQLEDLEDRTTNALLGVLARLEIVEHVVSGLLQDLYVDDDEPADNVSGHDREVRDEVRDEVRVAEAANEDGSVE